jgi:hypothetical protein
VFGFPCEKLKFKYEFGGISAVPLAAMDGKKPAPLHIEPWQVAGSNDSEQLNCVIVMADVCAKQWQTEALKK